MAWIKRQIRRARLEHAQHRAQHLIRALQAYAHQRSLPDSLTAQVSRHPVAVLVELLIRPLDPVADYRNAFGHLGSSPLDAPIDRLERTKVHRGAIPLVQHQLALVLLQYLQLFHFPAWIRCHTSQNRRIRGQPTFQRALVDQVRVVIAIQEKIVAGFYDIQK